MTVIAPFSAEGSSLLAAILGIYFLAGLVKGALGFGLPMVAVTVLPFLVPVELALALNAIVIVITNIQQIRQSGAAVQGVRAAWPLMAGMILTVPPGALLVGGMDSATLTAILGGFILVFVMLSLFDPSLRVPPGWERRSGFGMGLLSGAIGALTSSPGPIFVMYMVALHLSRPVYLAALGTIMLLFGAMAMASYAWIGVLRTEHLALGLGCTLPGMAGMWLGNRAGKRLPLPIFRRALLIGLAILAIVSIRRALV